MEPSFSGFVSKANTKCTDGRTIAEGAFEHQDGAKVPLVYQHNHDDVEQVLGHVILKKMPEGMWGDAFLNKSAKAQSAKAALENKDLDKMSIWAKDLDERSDYSTKQVLVHDGVIQEVSLVLAGANPGAIITNVLAHSVNGVDLDPEEDLIAVTGEIVHSSMTEEKPAEVKPGEEKPEEKPAEEGDKTVNDVLATLTPEQQTAVNAFTGAMVVEAVTEALTEEPKDEIKHDDLDSEKGPNMTRNLFDANKKTDELPQLKHDDVKAVLSFAKGPKGEGGDGSTGSLKELVRGTKGKELMHADTYGVQNLEILFPDAQAIANRPTFVDRRQDWVKKFMAGTSHTPFSRIKTMYADITADEARAKGYIKAHEKTEEVFPVFKRTTGPAWIYKKQKLDRQDIIDIVDFDVVAWMKVEMRGKLDEEIARAALFGDGRPVMIGSEMNPDKILEPTGNSGDGIRSIVNDDDLYSTTFSVQLPEDPSGSEYNILLDTVVESQEHYLGSGHKTAFMTYRLAAKLLTIRDDFGRRIYRNLSEVAGDMDVAEIVRTPTELFPTDVLCIILDLADYNFGTNRGGEITLFDDFDIDFNQYKYLIETYLSGALVLPYSAQIYKSVAPTAVELVPTAPAVANNVITVPTQTGVVYKRTDTGATLSQGSTVTLNDTTLKSLKIEATPANGYFFASNDDQLDSWTSKYKA